MRAVIYARYSSQNQRDASIEDQVRLCREFVENPGWNYLHAYIDRAISGASPLRSGYQKLMEDARSGEFDVVVAEALDRLSRDQEDVAGLYKRLSFSGNCGNRRSIKRSVLESLILDALKSQLMHPDLVKEFVSAFHKGTNRLNRDRELARDRGMKELNGVSRKLDNLIEAIADGLRAPGLKSKLEEL